MEKSKEKKFTYFDLILYVIIFHFQYILQATTMICPDTWKFETPNTSVSYEITDLSEGAYSKLKKKILSHYFNKLVSDFWLLLRNKCEHFYVLVVRSESKNMRSLEQVFVMEKQLFLP